MTFVIQYIGPQDVSISMCILIFKFLFPRSSGMTNRNTKPESEGSHADLKGKMKEKQKKKTTMAMM